MGFRKSINRGTTVRYGKGHYRFGPAAADNDAEGIALRNCYVILQVQGQTFMFLTHT